MWSRQPNREDILNIVHRMYEKDGISRDEVEKIVDTFPNQGTYLYVMLVQTSFIYLLCC